MGYVVKKVRTKADGSIYWQVVYEDRRQDRPKDTPREQSIARKDLGRLGIHSDDTIDKVREVCRHLNSKENLEKRNERVRSRSMAVQNREYLVESAFLPTILTERFEQEILFKRFAGDEKTAKFQRLISHWKFAQKLIAELQIEPKDYADESRRIYAFFKNERISPSYTAKIIRIVNAWGQFYTKRSGGTGIEEIKMPRGKLRQEIVRAYEDKEEYKGPGDALSPEALEAKTKALSTENYNWLYLSVWLGLRPEEIENLRNPLHSKTQQHTDGETSVLWIFQTKLVSIDRAKAWKPIPLIHKNQRRCLGIIQSGQFKKPLNKTLRKAFPEARIVCYSGRKGFTDLMLTLGQALEEISVWMGHKSIDTTWAFYKLKQEVRFKKLAA